MAKNVMAPMGRIIWAPNPIPARMAAMKPALDHAIGATMAFHAPQLEAHMRNNAPWTDQTSNARNGLTARPFKEGDNQGIELSHGVPYGIWLEVRHSGRYAIVAPTVQEKSGEVMETIRDIMRRL